VKRRICSRLRGGPQIKQGCNEPDYGAAYRRLPALWAHSLWRLRRDLAIAEVPSGAVVAAKSTATGADFRSAYYENSPIFFNGVCWFQHLCDGGGYRAAYHGMGMAVTNRIKDKQHCANLPSKGVAAFDSSA